MKKARLFLTIPALATVGLLSISSLSSCKKDKICPVGYGGKDCNVEVRTAYNGTYSGNGMDNNGHQLNNWTFKFSPTGSDVTHMNLVISNGSITPINLSARLTGNSSFVIDPNATETTIYSGKGTITGTKASISWTHTYKGQNGAQYTVDYNFPVLVKQ